MDLTEANKISFFVIIKITSTSHMFKLFAFFHNDYKMKLELSSD